MNSLHFRTAALGLLMSGVAVVPGLWAWNTLGGLFDLPPAQFKHALAAAVGLLLL